MASKSYQPLCLDENYVDFFQVTLHGMLAFRSDIGLEKLMVHRISNTAAAAYYIYGAPFEIVVASIFLYK